MPNKYTSQMVRKKKNNNNNRVRTTPGRKIHVAHLAYD
jgi:hypothetical protein